MDDALRIMKENPHFTDNMVRVFMNVLVLHDIPSDFIEDVVIKKIEKHILKGKLENDTLQKFEDS